MNEDLTPQQVKEEVFDIQEISLTEKDKAQGWSWTIKSFVKLPMVQE